ncbi:MAG: hypothetical protein ACXVBW_11795, partial [Bdellovibrionota bacterium]
MVDLIIRYRKAVLVFLALLTAVACVGIAQLNFGAFGSLPLPATDPAFKASEEMGDRFGGTEVVSFLIETPDALSPQSIKILGDLTEDAKSLTGVTSSREVLSLATISEPEP